MNQSINGISHGWRSCNEEMNDSFGVTIGMGYLHHPKKP